MATVGLQLQLSDFRTAAIAERGWGSIAFGSLSAAEQAEITRLILRGETTFWLHPPGVEQPFVWKSLRDPGLLDLWGSVAIGATTVSQTGTTMTASAAAFYKTMIGKTVVVTGEGSFTIVGYTSSTVVTVLETDSYSTKTFSIASDGSYKMPSDFESPETPQLVHVSTNTAYPNFPLTDESEIVRLRGAYTYAGYPQLACIRPASHDGTAQQGWELLVWPTPDQRYPVAMPYIAQPTGMSDANPYPRGGAAMSNALLAVILAVVEEATTDRRGDRWAEAERMCSAAAVRDAARHHNFYLGHMRQDTLVGVRLPTVRDLILPFSPV